MMAASSAFGTSPSDASLYERCRDSALALLETKVFRTIAVLHVTAIIADGAFFFFIMMGWTAIAPHRPATQTGAMHTIIPSLQALCIGQAK